MANESNPSVAGTILDPTLDFAVLVVDAVEVVGVAGRGQRVLAVAVDGHLADAISVVKHIRTDEYRLGIGQIDGIGHERVKVGVRDRHQAVETLAGYALFQDFLYSVHTVTFLFFSWVRVSGNSQIRPQNPADYKTSFPLVNTIFPIFRWLYPLEMIDIDTGKDDYKPNRKDCLTSRYFRIDLEEISRREYYARNKPWERIV